MRSGNLAFTALLLTVGFFPAQNVYADVLFTTMPYVAGQNDPTVPVLGPSAGGGYVEIAEQFTLSATSTFTSADVAFFHTANGTNTPLTLTLYDAVNGLPSTALASGVIPSISDFPTATGRATVKCDYACLLS